MWRGKKNRIVLILLLMAPLLQSAGQKMVNSPYARFNLGILEARSSFRSAGMGGISVTLRDNSSFSFNNPASYSAADTNSFVFDFGLDFGSARLKEGSLRGKSEDANFHHLGIMLPIMKGWGVGIGITPYSNGYYNISRTITEDDPAYDPVAGEVMITHKGSGGFTRAFIGTGAEFFGGLSVGVNMNIIFGETERYNEYAYISDFNLFDSRMEEKISLNGIGFDAGLQYRLSLSDNRYLIAGATYSLGSDYKSDYSKMVVRFIPSYAAPGVPFSADTLNNTILTGGTASLPSTIRGGIGFGINNKLSAGIDYEQTDWTKASIYGAGNYLAKSNMISGGIEFIPDRFSILSPLNRLEYRAGGRIANSYLSVNGEQINEFGITFGVGVPIRRSWSKANFFFDYSRRNGSLNSGLHTENIFSFGLSLNLYDYWFIKRKYD